VPASFTHAVRAVDNKGARRIRPVFVGLRPLEHQDVFITQMLMRGDRGSRPVAEECSHAIPLLGNDFSTNLFPNAYSDVGLRGHALLPNELLSGDHCGAC
jgi:hypothetical protein